jgi:hypothetical protein
MMDASPAEDAADARAVDVVGAVDAADAPNGDASEDAFTEASAPLIDARADAEGTDGASGDASVLIPDGAADAATMDGATEDASVLIPDGGADAVTTDGDSADASVATPDAGVDAATDAATQGAAPSLLCSNACGPGAHSCNGGCWSSATCAPSCNAHFDCPSVAHTTFACGSTGQPCTIAACDPGWADCNGTPSDGCETDVTTPTNCGTCGTTCSGSNYLCGAAGCEAKCASNESFCTGNRCVDLEASPRDCGSCGAACAGPSSGGSSMCSGGACSGLACPSGGTLCGTACVPDTTVTCGTTCGVDTTRDPNNCGSCGNVCTPPAGALASTCVDSQCVFECSAKQSTICGGACVATSVDPNNCGACGNACAAGEVCVQPGQCVDPSSLVLAAGLNTPGALATDAARVYWLDAGNYTVNAMPKSGGAVQVLAEYQYDLTNGMQIALDDTYVYWIANGILRTRKDGTGAVETVIIPSPMPTSLAVIGGNAYYGTSGSYIDYVPVTGGSPATYACGEFQGLSGSPLISDGKSIYFLQVMTEYRLLLACTPPATDSTYFLTLDDLSGGAGLSPMAPGYALNSSFNYSTNAVSYSIVPTSPSAPQGCAPPNMTSSMLWQPTACGYVVDYGSGGLELASGSSPNVAILPGATVAALGDFTQILFDPDGYEYFIDGHHEIGRLSVW